MSYKYRLMRYDLFFQKVTGFSPFPYQARFAAAAPQNATLSIPTGGAKTLTVLMRWLWRHHQGLPVATRLVIVEPMRVLVAQIVSECQKVVHSSGLGFPVHQLLGGSVDNNWIDYPERPAIIVGTQDQILSRSLMRGYACSRWSWPKHFALLHNDCEYFVDETQLMGPGYSTSAWLAALRAKQGTYGSVTTTWASATLSLAPLEKAGIDYDEWRLETEDFEHPVLGARISRKKLLHPAKTVLTQKLDTFAEQLASEVLSHHEAGTLSLVILSQVDRAIAVFERLQNSDVPLKLLHSRFRRSDRAQLAEGLLQFKGILVSTQVVEAGVDLDARRLYTDLCSWASFVQRAGRCGRREETAHFPAVDIHWIRYQSFEEGLCLPYSVDDCQQTADTLSSLSKASIPDASIQTLLSVDTPTQASSGRFLSEDALCKLFDTHPSADGSDEDIQVYIRDIKETNCSVAWFVGDVPPKDWLPTEDDLCPVPVSKLKGFSGYVWNAYQEEWSECERMKVKPGQIVVLPQHSGGYSTAMGWTGKQKDIPEVNSIISRRDLYSNDLETERYPFVSLQQHSLDVRYQMMRIGNALSFDIPAVLLEIAQWHDLGKGHEVFQEAINAPKEVKGAKGRFVSRYKRRGFRHELASALAALYHKKPFFFAYLLAAHHGKVRVKIEPMFYEKGTYRGIKLGEKLPEVNLGDGQIVPEAQLKIDAKDIEGWWKEEVCELVESVGVFRLAYLESLVRAADVQASSQYPG